MFAAANSANVGGDPYAWSGATDAPDARVVYWTRGTSEHHWRVQASTHRSGPFDVESVSGPYVFGRFSTGPTYVIDTRTGAAATLGKWVDYGPATSGPTAYFPQDAPVHQVATVKVDTSKLPELHC